MDSIRITDITQSKRAISAIDGDKVFDKIQAAFEHETPITIDFEGIDLTITAFLNASIGKLYSKYSSEQIKKFLEIKNLPNDEVKLLKIVIDRAKQRFSKEYPQDLDSIDIVNED